MIKFYFPDNNTIPLVLFKPGIHKHYSLFIPQFHYEYNENLTFYYHKIWNILKIFHPYNRNNLFSKFYELKRIKCDINFEKHNFLTFSLEQLSICHTFFLKTPILYLMTSLNNIKISTEH